MTTQSKGLVTLLNPNFVRPGVTPIALDILCSHLERAGFEVEVLDLTWERDTWRAALGSYFATRRPLLVGVTLRNAATVQPQEQRVFLPDHLEVLEAVRALTTAPLVLGGAGFSTMPYAALEYFRAPYGVKGPGEVVLCALAEALSSGRSPEGVAGLLLYDGVKARPAGGLGHPRAGATLGRDVEARYERRSGVPWRVDNRAYYDRGGLGNVLTKNGCSFSCNHCVEPDAKGKQLARRAVRTVVDELESLASQGIFDLHTTDSEFNLSLPHTKALLRELLARRREGGPLRDLRLWVYLHPVPFDEELADLMAEAGCKGASISAEHLCREDLARWGPELGGAGLAYDFADVERVTRSLAARGVSMTVELLLGVPGETLETMKRAIDASLSLPTTVAGFTLGLQVFPYAPLGLRMAAESQGQRVVRGLQSNTARGPILLAPLERCASRAAYERQFWFDEEGRVRPVFYFSPELPEDPETLARPDGRWVRTIEWIQRYVPAEEHDRVALPTVAGDGKDDNNYADNPFLQRAVALGFKGAYYSWWRRRREVMGTGEARG